MKTILLTLLSTVLLLPAAALSAPGPGEPVIPSSRVKTLSGGILGHPRFIASGPDGNLWFTQSANTPTSTQYIARMTPAGKLTEFKVGSGLTPEQLAFDRRGRIWFTTETNDRRAWIGMLEPSTGVVTLFKAGSGGGIALGPDGNMWFAMVGLNAIGRVTADGTITTFPLSRGATPWGIVAGPDGNMWFTEASLKRSAIGRISMDGAVREFRRGVPRRSSPWAITRNRDGNLWFTTKWVNRVGRITPAGAVKTFSLGAGKADGASSEIVSERSGALWLTHPPAGVLQKVSNTGKRLGRWTDRQYNRQPTSVTIGADHNLWVTFAHRPALGRLTLPQP